MKRPTAGGFTAKATRKYSNVEVFSVE